MKIPIEVWSEVTVLDLGFGNKVLTSKMKASKDMIRWSNGIPYIVEVI